MKISATYSLENTVIPSFVYSILIVTALVKYGCVCHPPPQSVQKAQRLLLRPELIGWWRSSDYFKRDLYTEAQHWEYWTDQTWVSPRHTQRALHHLWHITLSHTLSIIHHTLIPPMCVGGLSSGLSSLDCAIKCRPLNMPRPIWRAGDHSRDGWALGLSWSWVSQSFRETSSSANSLPSTDDCAELSWTTECDVNTKKSWKMESGAGSCCQQGIFPSLPL